MFERELRPRSGPPAESQADQVAAEVALGGTPLSAVALDQAIARSASLPARPALDRGVPDAVGRRLGMDLGGVRMVRDSREPEGLGTPAFAEGDAIHFAPGAYRPDLPLGRALIAHELTHVAQTRTGARPGPGELAAHERAHALAPVPQPPGLRLRLCGGGTKAAKKGAVFAGAHDAPGGPVKHLPGDQVDAFLAASPSLGPYVKAPRAAGKAASGRVHFYSHGDFVEAWVKYALTKNNPDTGKTYTEAEARSWVPRAFTADDDEIHIDETAGEPRTAIHESIHFYEDDAFTALGYHVSEAFTELLAQKIVSEKGIVSAENPALADDLSAARKLAGVVTLDAIAKAYFNGDIAGLRAAVDAAKGAGTFDKWKGYMTQRPPDYAAANALL